MTVRNSKKTTWTLIFRVITSDYKSILFFVVAWVLILANLPVDMEVQNRAIKLINTIASKNAPYTVQIDLLRTIVFFVSLHYSISALESFAKASLSTLMFAAALGHAVEITTQMENRDFHKRGHSKSQDDIQKMAYAMREIASLGLIEISKAIVTTLYLTYKFSEFLRGKILILFVGAMVGCLMVALLITVYVKRNESHFISLYKPSLLVLSDILGNFDLIQAFNKEEIEARRYSSSLRPFVRKSVKYYGSRELFSFIQKFMIMCPHFMVLYFLVSGDSVGLTDAMKYNSLFMSYRKNILSLRDNAFLFTRYYVESGCILESRLQDRGGPIAVCRLNDRIDADNLELRVEDEVLSRNLTFSINRGEKVAITGENGCGKSTFLKTLLRFHKNGGKILIDGVEIGSLDVASLRRIFSYVPQDQHIMNGTVLFNLSYGQDKVDEETIYYYCKKFGCHDFFMNLPEGYHTQTGERGEFLSGGQKQRINFMRAIIRNSPVILLDEPTSALDKQSEEDFVRNVIKHTEGYTVIMVIHDLDKLHFFDKILFFKKNGVESYTSYEKFVERRSSYFVNNKA